MDGPSAPRDREDFRDFVLPPDLIPKEFDRSYRPDFTRWRPAVLQVCAAHGLSSEEIRPFLDGSNLVAAVPGSVVKIFPPFHRHQWESERRVLPLLWDRTPLAVPQLLAQGERADGWTYVVITELEGDSLEERWPGLSEAERVRALGVIGETMAAVHRIPVDAIGDLPPDWNGFLAAQRAKCRQRHEARGLPAALLSQLDAFLDRFAPAPSDSSTWVLLTGEYTPFNLLGQDRQGVFTLTGMIDCGDAMVGPAEYDLLGPSLFLAAGDASRMDALFTGDRGRSRPTEAMERRRLLALALLHRYSNLDVQLRRPGWRESVGSLEELAEWIWPRVGPAVPGATLVEDRQR